uniref:Uncharacterized protein n=1 Tax=Amasya cherry disease-associated mycovirus TaxID=284689 RepID=Q1HA35_9VIRU|nr:hypothetical protein [Amasya cherry disease-associated mycovirus]
MSQISKIFRENEEAETTGYSKGLRGIEDVLQSCIANEAPNPADRANYLNCVKQIISDRVLARDNFLKGLQHYCVPQATSVNPVVGAPAQGFGMAAAGQYFISASNLIPVDEQLEAYDGILTAGAMSSERMAVGKVPLKAPMRAGSVTVNTFVITPRSGDVRAITTRTSFRETQNMSRNVLTVLTAASFEGEFFNTELDGVMSFRKRRPLISTSHVVETGKGVASRRDYDVSMSESTQIINIRQSLKGKKIKFAPGAELIHCAMVLAYHAVTDVWKSVFGSSVPEQYDQKTPNAEYVIRSAIASLNFKPSEHYLLVAEAAASLACVYGMADESMVESISPAITVLEPAGNLVTSGMPNGVRATQVIQWQTQGVLTLELAMTRLFSVFTSQADKHKYERMEHYAQLRKQGANIFNIDSANNFVTAKIAALMATNRFLGFGGKHKHYEELIVTPTGHGFYEIVDKEEPFMRSGVLSSRSALTSDSVLGSAIRTRYTTDIVSEGSYACSVTSQHDEYVQGPQNEQGVLLTNVAAPRATAGALNSLMAWVDNACVADGNDRSDVNIISGQIIGAESRIMAIAPELRRYGFELRVDDEKVLGIGNPRKDYAFTTTSHSRIAVPITSSGRPIGTQASKSLFLASLSSAIADETGVASVVNLYRALMCIRTKRGVCVSPMKWHDKKMDLKQLIVGSATYRSAFNDAECANKVVITSSSINRPVFEFGGFDKRSLLYGVAAARHSDATGTFYVKPEMARAGTRAASAVYTALQSGQYIDQADLSSWLDAAAALAEEGELEFTWHSQRAFNFAKEVYCHSLTKHPKRSLARLVWHACTGYALTLTKRGLKYKNDKLNSAEMTPAARLDQVHALFANSTPKVRYIASLMVGVDANWPNYLSLVHTYQVCVSETGKKSQGNIKSVHEVMSTPKTCVKNRKCPRMPSPCQTSCCGYIRQQHVCRKCKQAISCALCVQAITESGVLVDGALEINKVKKTPSIEDVKDVKMLGTEHIADIEYADEVLAEKQRRPSDRSEDIREQMMLNANALVLKFSGRKGAHSKKLSVDVETEQEECVDFDGGLTPSPVKTQGGESDSSAEVTSIREDIRINNAELVLEPPRPEVSDEVADKLTQAKEFADSLTTTSSETRDKKSWDVPYMNAAEEKVYRTERVREQLGRIRRDLMEEQSSDDESFKKGNSVARPPTPTTCQDLGGKWSGMPLLTCGKEGKCPMFDHEIGVNTEVQVMAGMSKGMPLDKDEMHPSSMDVSMSWKINWFGNSMLNSQLKLNCGNKHNVTGPHFCLFKKQGEEHSILALAKKADMFNKIAPAQIIRTIEPKIPQPPPTFAPGQATFRDVTRYCVCLGCTSFKQTKDKRSISGSFIDFPIWHWELSEVRELDIRLPHSFRNCRLGELHQHLGELSTFNAVVPWLSNMLGFLVTPVNLEMSLEYGEFHIRNPIIAGVKGRMMKNEYPYQARLYFKNAQVTHVNLVHMSLPCCHLGYGNLHRIPVNQKNSFPHAARVVIDKSIVLTPHDDEIKLYKFIAAANLLWPDAGQTTPVYTTIIMTGAVVGDMRHYRMFRPKVNGQMGDTARIMAFEEPTRIEEVELGTKMKTGEGTIAMMRQFWSEDTLQYIN